MKLVIAIVLGCIHMWNAGVLATNAAADMIQEEVQVGSVSVELCQTSLIHLFYICILYLFQLLISIRKESSS